MKSLYIAISTLPLMFFFSGSITIDLHKEVQNKNIIVVNRELSLINEPAYKGIRLSKEYGEGIAWLKGVEFSNGTIEFDMRGEDIKQHSFVGIAFHGKNDSTYDAVYLRPFQFKAEDQISKKKSIQYISLPDFTWRKLRETSPGTYENSIEPSPDPNSWVHVRIVVKDSLISTYINHNEQPSLVVKKVTSAKSGTVGFYVADTSGGDFANIKITKE
jgi:hypothetical protein